MNMLKAQYSDKSLVVDILAKSFDSNLSVNFVVKQDKKRTIRVKKLMEYCFEMSWHFGEVYISPDKKGVVLFTFPDKKKTTLKAILLNLFLLKNCISISNVRKIADREAKIKSYQPGHCMFLWYIGVLPNYQGRGIGQALLKDVVELSIERKLPVYLTTTCDNLPFYQKQHFNVYGELDFNYTLYLLQREPEVYLKINADQVVNFEEFEGVSKESSVFIDFQDQSAVNQVNEL
jgi:hypothetical protein